MKKSSVKRKSLFDHIRQITAVQSPNYWEEISDEDKKSWSNYMTHRFLSMKMEWVELVNEIQKYNLQPKELYKLYINVLPKGKQWLKYIKRRNQMDYPNWLINIVVNEEEVSKKEVNRFALLLFTLINLFSRKSIASLYSTGFVDFLISIFIKELYYMNYVLIVPY